MNRGLIRGWIRGFWLVIGGKTMQSFAFRANSGDLVTVTAPDETTARHLAMVKLHGNAPQAIGEPPSTIGRGGKWAGNGLTLALPPGPTKPE